MQFLKKATEKGDTGVVFDNSKNFFPHAKEAKYFEQEFDKETLKKLKGKKGVAVLPGEGRGFLNVDAHELGHTEHMAGRGSKLGRIAHKIGYLGLGKKVGLAGGALAGGVMSEDNQYAAGGVGAASGAVATIPELLAEHSANKEALKIMERAGVNKKFRDLAKKSYRPQIAARVAGKTIPAAALGFASGYAANRIKKEIKKRKEKKDS